MPGARRARSSLIVGGYDEAIAWFTEKLGFTLVEDAILDDTKRWVLVAPPGSSEGAATPLPPAYADLRDCNVGFRLLHHCG